MSSINVKQELNLFSFPPTSLNMNDTIIFSAYEFSMAAKDDDIDPNIQFCSYLL